MFKKKKKSSSWEAAESSWAGRLGLLGSGAVSETMSELEETSIPSEPANSTKEETEAPKREVTCSSSAG